MTKHRRRTSQVRCRINKSDSFGMELISPSLKLGAFNLRKNKMCLLFDKSQPLRKGALRVLFENSHGRRIYIFKGLNISLKFSHGIGASLGTEEKLRTGSLTLLTAKDTFFVVKKKFPV